ncbi:MAG: hypothetical protein V4478_02560 [Patescibacteria group bacterium]
MKNILILLAVSTLLFSACSEKITSTGNNTYVDNSKKPAEGFSGGLIFHPVQNKVTGDGKTFDLIYDYPNRALLQASAPEVFPKMQSFLPEVITVDSIGRIYTFESSNALPLSSLTPQVTNDIAQSTGMRFGSINAFNNAKTYNEEAVRNSLESYKMMLRALNGEQEKRPEDKGRILVDGAQTVLRKHPIRNTMKGIKDTYYTFYDLKNGRMYFTEDANLYESFSNAILVEQPAIKNAVAIQGAAITPLIYFEEGSLNEIAQNLGIEVDGGKEKLSRVNPKDGKVDSIAIAKKHRDLNSLPLIKITGFFIVVDVEGVTSALTAEITRLDPGYFTRAAAPYSGPEIRPGTPQTRPGTSIIRLPPPPIVARPAGTQPPSGNGTVKPGTSPASNDRKVY